MEVKKGQAIIIIFMIILLMIVSLLLPLILLQSVTKSFQIESGSSSSVVLAEKELQIEEVNNGDPLIKVYQNSQGIDYIKFEYIHGITPLDIEYIFYYDYDKAEWLLAYPGSYIVSGNTTLYLYTPPYYNGIIEIITSLGNAFYLPVQSSIGLTTCANIYNITQVQTITPILILPNGTSITLQEGTLIITPEPNSLPKIATGNVNIPAGSTIILTNGNEVSVPKGAILELGNSILIQKCIESGYFPISSFLTGYQSDNDNIGTIPLEERNPQLQTQTLVQWFIASGNIYPIKIISNSPSTKTSTPQANVAYYSDYAPTGGYMLWSGDAGLIIGGGFCVNNNNKPSQSPSPLNPSSSQYYLAFTVQLYNGTWVTIVDPNPLPQIGNENGQPSSALTLAVGTYDAQTGTIALYINGTLVSEVKLKPNLMLNASATSFMDVGSVYNGSGNNILLKSLPGFSGDIFDAGNNEYSFNGALGPSFIYNISLTSAQIKALYQGQIPSPNNIVVLWSQNTAEEVYLNTKTGSTEPAYYTTMPPPNPSSVLSSEAVEVYNLADLSNLNGFWGWAGAIPTAFAPFSDIIIWGGPSPVLFNPTLIQGKNINITFESQGLLIPKEPGNYIFSVNFTDNVPIAENNQAPNGYANEWVVIYINGQKVFEGKYIDNQLNVLYSNVYYFQQRNMPEFSYDLTKAVNLTVIFTFNLDVKNENNQGVPAIYFNLMWMPPGSQWFQYIPITSLQPFIL